MAIIPQKLIQSDFTADELTLVPVPHGYRCSICKKFKLPQHFTIDRTRSGNVGSLCRKCKSLHVDKPYSKRTKAARAIKFKVHRYGITEEAYHAMYARQSGACAICQKPETKHIKGSLATLAVDHDHTTGVVRGLLCSKCNRGLGMFHEDIARLTVAIAYLVQSKSTTT